MSFSSCPKCHSDLKDEKICGACGLVLEKYRQFEAEKSARQQKLHSEKVADELSDFEKPPQKIMPVLIVLPAMATLAWIILTVPIFGIFSYFTSWIHEFGHTLVSWCSGHNAVPTPLYTVRTSEEKSAFIFLIGLALSSFGAFKLIQKKAYYLGFLLVAYAICTIYFTLIASNHSTEGWIVYSGIGAQYWLSTLLVISYYYRLPKKEGWENLRYVAPMYGMICLVKTSTLFNDIKNGKDFFPMGSALGGPDDPNGDLQRLINEFGWNEYTILQSYLRLGKICAAVVIAHYLFFLFRAVSSQNKRA